MLKQINDLECLLISNFKEHPVFNNINAISWNDFLTILIQRRFLSLSIVNIYEFIIDALLDENIKKIVRNILNEEYPRNTKGIPLLSHRELLFHDLLNLGATYETILKTAESTSTKTIKEDSYQLMSACFEGKYPQAGLITFLRFWAEVLVSVEYSCLWKRISERLSATKTTNKARSEFYYFHMIHDARNSDIGKEGLLGGLTHSQELAIHLQRLIVSEKILDECIKIEKDVYEIKYKFYNQFLNF
jgi:hypothetical protein